MNTLLGSLALFPSGASAPLDMEEALTRARALGLIGITRSTGSQAWLSGPRLAEHISFAGCSPQLHLVPTDADIHEHLHWRLHGPFPEARLWAHSALARPRCPICSNRIGNWLVQLGGNRAAGAPIRCDSCEAVSTCGELRWRRHGAVARLLLELRGVFPGEAAPTDQVLAKLGDDGDPWDYAWIEATD